MSQPDPNTFTKDKLKSQIAEALAQKGKSFQITGKESKADLVELWEKYVKPSLTDAKSSKSLQSKRVSVSPRRRKTTTGVTSSSSSSSSSSKPKKSEDEETSKRESPRGRARSPRRRTTTIQEVSLSPSPIKPNPFQSPTRIDEEKSKARRRKSDHPQRLSTSPELRPQRYSDIPNVIESPPKLPVQNTVPNVPSPSSYIQGAKQERSPIPQTTHVFTAPQPHVFVAPQPHVFVAPQPHVFVAPQAPAKLVHVPTPYPFPDPQRGDIRVDDHVFPPSNISQHYPALQYEREAQFLLWFLIAFELALGLLILSIILPASAIQPVRFCDTYMTSDDSRQYGCRLCPAHAEFCSDGQVHCRSGHKYSELAGDCVVDKAVDKQAQNLIPKLKTFLAQQAGNFECNIRSTKTVSQDEVKAFIGKQISRAHDVDATYSLLRQNLLDKSSSQRDNIFIQTVGVGLSQWGTLDPPIIPWSCKINRGIISFIIQYAWLFITVAIVAFVWFYLAWQRNSARTRSQEVKELANAAMEWLITTRENSLEDSNIEPFVAIEHLRDSLVVGRSLADKVRIWRDVEKQIDTDSRVAKTPRILRGEQHLTWEWVGPTTRVRAPGHHSQ